MRPADEVIRALTDRNWLEFARQAARLHGLTLERLLGDSDSHEVELVQARYALYQRLRAVLPSNAAVARFLGLDHSTIDRAVGEPPAVVEVQLATFDVIDGGAPTGEGFVFRWQRRPHPFGVTTVCATAGDSPGAWERQTEWFDRYAEARERFQALCREHGAPSFAGRASEVPPPPPLRETPTPAAVESEAT